MSRPLKEHSNRGFTLIELLAVITIIAILVALVIAAGRYAKIKATEGRARAELQHIGNALTEYQIKFSVYPATLQLMMNDRDAAKKLPVGVDLIDPWNNGYVYAPGPQNLSYSLHSKGRLSGASETSDDLRIGK